MLQKLKKEGMTSFNNKIGIESVFKFCEINYGNETRITQGNKKKKSFHEFQPGTRGIIRDISFKNLFEL